MGKGTILSGGAAGLYNVRLNFDLTRLNAEIAKLNALISEIDVTTLPTLQLALLDAQTAKDAALTAVDLAIEAFRAGTGTLEQLEKKQVALVTAAADVDRAQLAVNNTIGRKLALEMRRTELQAVPVSADVSAWCADLTENLTGEVGTIEIPGQRAGVPVLIRPGYSGAAAYTAARDGQLQPVKSSTPNAAFVNYALLPGWQKWKPLHRIGTISALNKSANTCTVTLDSARSTAQNMSVNAQSVYTGVPISYMTCNANAFENGDRVVVEFIGQDYAQPRVIGFENTPRACDTTQNFILQFHTFTENVDGFTEGSLCPAFSVPMFSHQTDFKTFGYRFSLASTYLGATPKIQLELNPAGSIPDSIVPVSPFDSYDALTRAVSFTAFTLSCKVFGTAAIVCRPSAGSFPAKYFPLFVVDRVAAELHNFTIQAASISFTYSGKQWTGVEWKAITGVANEKAIIKCNGI